MQARVSGGRGCDGGGGGHHYERPTRADPKLLGVGGGFAVGGGGAGGGGGARVGTGGGVFGVVFCLSPLVCVVLLFFCLRCFFFFFLFCFCFVGFFFCFCVFLFDRRLVFYVLVVFCCVSPCCVASVFLLICFVGLPRPVRPASLGCTLTSHHGLGVCIGWRNTSF